MKVLLGTVEILLGIFIAAYLAIYVMLYGGILQAVTNWGINDSLVVWGLIKALFFEIGLIPGYLLIFIGTATLHS